MRCHGNGTTVHRNTVPKRTFVIIMPTVEKIYVLTVETNERFWLPSLAVLFLSRSIFRYFIPIVSGNYWSLLQSNNSR